MGKRSSAAKAAPAYVFTPAPAPDLADNWEIELHDGIGHVRHLGDPKFSCKFQRASTYNFEDASQEMKVLDPNNGRVFYDFTFARFETPSDARMSELATQLMRRVQARVGRR